MKCFYNVTQITLDFKRCDLKKYRKKVRENEMFNNVTQVTLDFKHCDLKKYGKKVRENEMFNNVIYSENKEVVQYPP